ncbi:hypothetical protein LCGC14_1472280 [marine sediment metagenome]|uniref:Uncharacterized protein n=1 Tax=marine sediment metagenome TaxID=412755 RepID=A0A0F9JC03_9ZZZZ
MDAATLKLLGLAQDATPDEIHERIADNASRAHDADTLDGKLEAATEAKTAAEAAVKKIAQERAAENSTRLATQRAKLDEDARGRGLWEPGSDTQKLFNRLADSDQSLELAKDFIATLSPNNPVGQPSQSGGNNPPPSNGLDAMLKANYGLDEVGLQVVKKQFHSMGITEKMFAEAAPHVRDAAEAEPGYDWLHEYKGGEQS